MKTTCHEKQKLSFLSSFLPYDFVLSLVPFPFRCSFLLFFFLPSYLPSFLSSVLPCSLSTRPGLLLLHISVFCLIDFNFFTLSWQCAEDDLTQEIISRNGGLELLVKIMASRSLQHKELLAAAIGALWKCALNKNNVKRYLSAIV